MTEEQLSLGQSLKVLVKASRAFWIVNFANFGDGIAYFGILTLLTRFLGTRLGMSDPVAGMTVACFTGLVALYMLNGGRISDSLGVRWALTASLASQVFGRGLLTVSPILPIDPDARQYVAWTALSIMAFGTGVLQPALYSGVKEYTDARTASIGWSLLYSIMNLGIVASSLVSPLLRTTEPFQIGRFTLFNGLGLGIDGVYWVLTGLTALLMLVNLVAFSHDIEVSERVTPKLAETDWRAFWVGALQALAIGAAMGGAIHDTPVHPNFWKPVDATGLAVGAIALYFYLRHLQPQFAFFIFILVPVRTLFAHQWLTIPDYVFRCFDPSVNSRFEWITGINPLIVTICVPLLAAATRRVPVINIMIVGTAISSVTTFLLAGPPNLGLLLTYMVLFSFGEAVWSARFLQYVADLAPSGQTGAYMGVANLPWFLAKFTTGLYSGLMLEHFIPKTGPQHPATLWLIYGVFTLVSPIGLLLGRGWILEAERRRGRSGGGDVQSTPAVTEHEGSAE